MYVPNMVGTITLFIKGMYRKKIKKFLGSVFNGRAGMLTNYLFLFGLSRKYLSVISYVELKEYIDYNRLF